MRRKVFNIGMIMFTMLAMVLSVIFCVQAVTNSKLIDFKLGLRLNFDLLCMLEYKTSADDDYIKLYNNNEAGDDVLFVNEDLFVNGDTFNLPDFQGNAGANVNFRITNYNDFNILASVDAGENVINTRSIVIEPGQSNIMEITCVSHLEGLNLCVEELENAKEITQNISGFDVFGANSNTNFAYGSTGKAYFIGTQNYELTLNLQQGCVALGEVAEGETSEYSATALEIQVGSTILTEGTDFTYTEIEAGKSWKLVISPEKITANTSISIVAPKLFENGFGNETSPYGISTATQLKNLSTYTNNLQLNTLNKHFQLLNNIVLNSGTFGIDNETDLNPTYNGSTTIPNTVEQWTPIGYGYMDESNASIPVTYFEGVFNGNNFKIQGMYINNQEGFQGVFALTAEETIIKNLVVTNSFVSGGANVGSIVGQNRGTIINCYNTNSVIGVGVWNIGGIVGANIFGVIENCINNGFIGSLKTTTAIGGITGGNSGTVKNCVNYGNIKASAVNSGGIVGHMHNNGGYDGEQIIENCANYGNVSGTGYVGGIVGYAANSGGKGIAIIATIKNCNNYGNINGTGSYVAGIAGNINPTLTIDGVTTIGSAEVIDCSNSGEINNTGSYVAGVVGQNVAGEITNCHNTGEINGNSYVSGVCGYATFATIINADESTSTYTSTISFCSNKGNVQCKGNVNYSEAYGNSASGICSHLNGGLLKNCFNYGNITALSHSGGVVGTANKNAKILNCGNSGNISGIKYIGGVCGFNIPATITNCYNTGNINIGYFVEVSSETSWDIVHMGGITGWAEGNVLNCWNSGEVSGNFASEFGGIAGRLAGDRSYVNMSVLMENCYNIGEVAEKGKTAEGYSGGILGRFVQKRNDATQNTTATLKSCYNLANMYSLSETPNQSGLIGEYVAGTITNCYKLDGCCESETNNYGTVLTSAQNGAMLISSVGINGDDFVSFNGATFNALDSVAETEMNQGVYMFKRVGGSWNFYKIIGNGFFMLAQNISTADLKTTYGATINANHTETDGDYFTVFSIKL